MKHYLKLHSYLGVKSQDDYGTTNWEVGYSVYCTQMMEYLDCFYYYIVKIIYFYSDM